MATDKSLRQHYAMQGKIKNYLGKQKMVKAPVKWKSGPDHPDTELAYITKAEKDLILKADLHSSLSKGPNRGPSGIISLNSAGSGYGGPGPGSGGGGGGGGQGGGNPNQDRAREEAKQAANKAAQDRAAAAIREAARQPKAPTPKPKTYTGPIHSPHTDTKEQKKEQQKLDIQQMIAKQQEEKYGPGADPTKMGETVEDLAFKNHPEARAEEAEETIKQLSTKEGTKEALKEFKALKTGRQYVPDLDLLEKLGIKKPEGILGSLIDTGQKYFDPKKMAFNVAKNYGMKKLGLGALNPYLGLLSLFGFNPFKSLTNKFAKKPDMSAFNKLGLQTDRFPTQTMDTRTARVPKTTAQKIESGEIDLNKLITGELVSVRGGGLIDRPLMGRRRDI